MAENCGLTPQFRGGSRVIVSKQDFHASWTIGKSGKVSFQTPLGELTKRQLQVTASFPDGKSARWQLSQLQPR